jgi:pyrroline-5-carboxylate reductase
MTTLEGKRIGIIGLGNMGGAVVAGLRQAGLAPEQFWVSCSTEERAKEKAEKTGLHCVGPSQYGPLLPETDVLLIAVKPHGLRPAMHTLEHLTQKYPFKQVEGKPACPVVSIVAGASLETLGTLMGNHIPIIRTMPNTTALVHEGVTALCSNAFVTPEQETCVDDLFLTVGETYWMEECRLNAFTGLFGSGPAYMMLMMEAFAEAGLSVGLPAHMVWDAVPRLMKGAALLQQQQRKHPAQLKAEVLTPGGTTIAGLQALEEKAVRAAIMHAVQAATERANVLSCQTRHEP